jgi:hypothetical protein
MPLPTIGEARAQNWQDAFTAVDKQVPAPGGVPWEGGAADAAVLHVGGDRLQAVGAADTLYGSAATARAGAYEIESAKQTALQAVQAAQDQGFMVRIHHRWPRAVSGLRGADLRPRWLVIRSVGDQVAPRGAARNRRPRKHKRRAAELNKRLA